MASLKQASVYSPFSKLRYWRKNCHLYLCISTPPCHLPERLQTTYCFLMRSATVSTCEECAYNAGIILTWSKTWPVTTPTPGGWVNRHPRVQSWIVMWSCHNCDSVDFIKIKENLRMFRSQSATSGMCLPHLQPYQCYILVSNISRLASDKEQSQLLLSLVLVGLT